MSTPEWMKKFHEIGQREEEEITAVGNEGAFVKTVEPSKRIDLDNTDAPVTRSTLNRDTVNDGNGKDVNNGSDDDDDAASIIYSTELGNRSETKEEDNRGEDPPTEITSEVGSTVFDEEMKDRNDPVEDQSRSSPTGLYERSLSAGEKNAVLVANDNNSPMGDEIHQEEEKEKSEGLPRDTEVSDDDFPEAMIDDETKEEELNFGASWVVDRNDISNEEREQRNSADEAARTTTIGGESCITDIYVDEDGNEISSDRNEIDTQEEEVLVDEDEDEIEIVPLHQLQRGEVDGRFEEYTTIRGCDDLSRNDNIDLPDFSTANKGANIVTTRSNINKEQAVLRSEASPTYDIEEQRRTLRSTEKGKRSRMSWVIPILVFLFLASAILLVVFFIVLSEDRTISTLSPVMTPALTPTPAPTEYPQLTQKISSSRNVDAAATTEFNTVQNSCDFDAIDQPNVIDQCDCGEGRVDILADDIVARWNYFVEDFVPTIYPKWKQNINSCSSENQALLWLSSGINNGGEINNLHRLQRYILAVVYYEQGGTEWRRSTNWLSSRHVCVWEGVECDENSYIRVLNLDQNRLTGQLSDAPTSLNAIEGYFVAKNNLSGSIPKLYFKSDTLNTIDFSENALSGEISSLSKGNKLTDINLAANSLNGSLPPSISNAAVLTILNVESNSFSGTLPASLFDLPLKYLAIGGNTFSGTIPVGLSGVSTLTSLSLGPNLFNGQIATSLSELTKLVQLSMIGLPDLGGRLPASFGISLTNLVELSISETGAEGDIPEQFSLMTNLEILRLNSNSLARNIPSSLGLLTNLRSLHLNDNALSGLIPPEIGFISVLQELQLHTNRLAGTIPEEIGNLIDIRTLTFDGNFMDGRTPIKVCDLRAAQLNKFIVDCPSLLGESQVVVGIICSIPDCCTECI